MRSLFRIFIATATPLLGVASCSSLPKLEMAPVRAPVDESAVAPETSQGNFRRIIVLPPLGSTRQQYETIIALFERELLRRGIKTISGGMMHEGTSNRPLTPSTTPPPESPTTDLDKILREAKKLGADAVLQITEWSWSKEPTASRFFSFVKHQEGGAFEETSEAEFHSFNGPKYSFSALELRFIGCLFNVENGEVLGSFEVKSPVNYNLPGRYVADMEMKNSQPSVQNENFVYSSPGWVDDSRKKTETAVVMAVCNRMMPSRNVSSNPNAPREDLPKPAPPAEKTEGFSHGGSFGADVTPDTKQ